MFRTRFDLIPLEFERPILPLETFINSTSIADLFSFLIPPPYGCIASVTMTTLGTSHIGIGILGIEVSFNQLLRTELVPLL